MDETREHLLRQKTQREQGRPATQEEIFSATLFRAELAKVFYAALRQLDFNHADAVSITAGQRF